MQGLSEDLRRAMRCWTTGVAVVTARIDNRVHGMTVNSFTSVSLSPPLVVVTMALNTRTEQMVRQMGWFGVTILHQSQADIADRFAGRISDEGDRFADLETFHLLSGAPFIRGGLAYLDCQVLHIHPLPASTLFMGEVRAVEMVQPEQPLVYHNRIYRRMAE